eukprot:COSAG01_NODE_3229_length_6382_cov_76.522521_2_plen_877_part_00
MQLDHDSFRTQDKFSHFVSDILDRQDQFGYTALHWCAAYNCADVARELLEHGCDPSICNHSGKTAWDVAESAESTEVLALFGKLAQAVEIADAQILHVRGVKGRDQEDLAKIFEQFGRCEGIAVRRRQEADGGSWAFVIMDSAKSADSARMKLMPTNAYGLRVEKYNRATARASTGAAAATQSKVFRAAGIARIALAKAMAAKVKDKVHSPEPEPEPGPELGPEPSSQQKILRRQKSLHRCLSKLRAFQVINLLRVKSEDCHRTALKTDTTYLVHIRQQAVFYSLRREWERRQRRPDVPPTSDDIEVDHARLTYWNVEPYENWKQIGEGKNGRVFLVTEVAPAIQIVYKSKEVRQFHQAVVKIPKPDGVEMLKAEVESLSVLEHKNVVEILGMAQGGAPKVQGNHWMMLLEFCESDLEKLLHVNDDPTHRDYSWELMGRLCREIVDGMAYLHGEEHEATKQTYMHLDLKPDNILLANEGTKEQPVWIAKIADFGWVPELTQDEWTGTALYMAPEFAIRNLELDRLMELPLPTDNVGPATDVFSFGVLLWEMFARQTPFEALVALQGAPRCSCALQLVEPLQDTSEGCRRMMSKWMVGDEQMRPAFPTKFPTPLRLLVEACWAEMPGLRPTFDQIRQVLMSTDVAWFVSPPTVQEWLDKLDLGAKTELFIEISCLQEGKKYLEDLETIKGAEFQELLEDMDELDEAVNDMIGEDDVELTEVQAAKLKAALRSLNGADPEAVQEPQDWHALCESLNLDLAAGEEAGDTATRVQQLEDQLQELQAQLAEKVQEVQELKTQHYHSSMTTHDYPHEMDTVESENKNLQDESHELKTPCEEAGRGDAAILSIESAANKTQERLQPTIPTRDHGSAPEPHETR